MMPLKEIQKGTGAYDARSFGGQVALKMFEYDFSGVTSYTTGGVAANIGVFYNDRKHGAIIPPKDGYFFEYDAENGKIKVLDADQEVAAATDLSDLGTVLILAFGGLY